ncbi:MAG: hypothetical protein ACO1N7_11835, partial [Sphingobacteriaceae bacterium]
MSLVLFGSCKKLEGGDNINDGIIFKGSGQISLAAETALEYGRHAISIDGKLYAIKSDNHDLDNYIKKNVSISGILLE